MSTLTWADYWALARRTESIPQNTYGKLDSGWSYNVATRLLHAAMGLVTETQELSDGQGVVNWVEELGDCWWYLTIIDNVLKEFLEGENLIGLDWDRTLEENQRDKDICINKMKHYAAELIDLVGKRHIFYGKSLETAKVQSAAQGYTYWLAVLVNASNYQLHEVWEANILKLEKRYPKLRFDETDAVNRDTENELSHIAAERSGGPTIPAKIEEDGSITFQEHPVTGEKFTLEPSSGEVWFAWNTLKASIFVDPLAPFAIDPHSSPEAVQAFVLNYLGATKEYAEAVLGEEFIRCQFKCLETSQCITFQAIPYEAPKPEILLIVDHKDFNTICLEHFTFDQIEKISMTAAFLAAAKYRNEGAHDIARAYDSLYSTYSGLGNKLADSSLWCMFKLLLDDTSFTTSFLLDTLHLWSKGNAAASSSV